MSTTERAPSEREEIEMLLPWFVTGRLEPHDKSRVEAALARDPALRRQLDIIRDEQHASIFASEAIAAPRSLTVERGMEAVAAGTTLGMRRSASGLFERLREFFTVPSPRAVRFVVAAAVAVVLLQAATIGSLVLQRSEYQTASDGSAMTGTTVIVKFADNAEARAITSTLQRLNMSIVDGPKPGGTFVVRLDPKPLSEADKKARIDELRKASGVVGLVLP